MAELTKPELYEQWRDRWEDFLHRIGTAESGDVASDRLRDKVIIGNAERKIAGGHEGREILELLQNARDAIWEGERDQGRVYVGVFDEGVLVANTGSRFDLFDTEVEDAVTMIGETGKGDDETQSIGHKGVGLKSILATGDSFEIFTRPDEKSDELLGVRLSRSYLLASIMDRLGHESDLSNLVDDIDDPDLTRLLNDGERSESIPLDEIDDDLSKLPLFNFPVPLAADRMSDSPVRKRVERLLTEEPTDPNHERFRTAVFIRYEDTTWRSQLEQIGVDPPDEEDRARRPVSERPEQIWDYLSHGESTGGLQPETVIQLGGIEELTLERVTEASTETSGKERWEISRTPTRNLSVDELAHAEVAVDISSPDDEVLEYRFDHFSFAQSREHHTAVLVNAGLGSEYPPAKAYPLYLFYPIDSTSDAGLPFCLHGRFRVDTNRKDLSSHKRPVNQSVLEEAIDLIELVARQVGNEAAGAGTSIDNKHLPWSLLPPSPAEDATDEPSTNDELLRWFQGTLLERLAETPCIGTPSGPEVPDQTLLHWSESVLRAYVAYEEILTFTERKRAMNAKRPIPKRELLEAIFTLPDEWSKRIEVLTVEGDPQSASGDILTDWVSHLEESLAMSSDGPPGVTAPSAAARDLIKGTVALLGSATGDDDSLLDLLNKLANEFEGIYLLPCEIRDVDPEDRLQLVCLERRVTPQGGQRNRQRIRSVIWNVESETRDVDPPPNPPKESSMTVYFLDRQIQQRPDVHHVLSVAGRAWGLREYVGIPSFVRSLLDTFADGREETVAPIDYAFLTVLVDRLGGESTDLQTGEGSYFPLEYLRTAITQQEGDQRANLRRRVQLRGRELHLYGDTPRPIGQTALPDGWQAALVKRDSGGDEDEDPTEKWQDLSAGSYPVRTWPEPETETWRKFRDVINVEVTDLDFARTLSLLGSGALASVRIVWLYGDDHPLPQSSPHWNPLEWSNEDANNNMAAISDLQAALEGTPGYLSAITGPEYHPRVTADHSSKCPVRTNGSLEGVNLASWIWIDDVEALERHAEAVREIVRRQGGSLESNLLWTGWSCNNPQHQRRVWDQRIPSLLNWQLRNLPVWGPIVDVDETLQGRWDEESERLRFAVRHTATRGAQAARMLPHVEETDIDDGVLATLGVKPVTDLGLTGASRRFQRLLEVLADGPLPNDGLTELWIPGERIDDWNQAYTQLLNPVLDHLPEDTDVDSDNVQWGELTHLPLRDGEGWVVASIDWIQANADEIRYYVDQSPKPWETHEVEKRGYLILPRPTGGPFRRLTRALDIEQLEAQKLVLDPDEDDLELVSDQYAEELDRFRSELGGRRDLIVASTERSKEDEIVATADDLTTATAGLAVAESFPSEALEQLSDPGSALYSTEAGEEALLLNAAEFNGSPRLSDLAMGLSLLMERPTKVATFREALRTNITVEELENQWRKRTFPVDTVKRVLGSDAMQSLERDLRALNDLMDQLGLSPVDVEPMLRELDEAGSDVVTETRSWLESGGIPDGFDSEGGTDEYPTEIESTIENVYSQISSHLSFVLSGLFSESITHWIRELESRNLDTETHRILVQWLADHPLSFERPAFEKASLVEYGRLMTVREVAERTDDEELLEIDTWVSRIRELHSDDTPSLTDSIDEKEAEILDCPPLVAHVCHGRRVETLVNSFCDETRAELPDIVSNWQQMVTTYVHDAELPEPTADSGAKDHQSRAFTDMARQLTSPDSEGIELDGVEKGTVDIADRPLEVRVGGGGGGGSSEFRGRGQQAEAYVVVTILHQMAEWMREHPTDIFQLRRHFRNLHAQQQVSSFKWHVEGVWQSELLPLLSGSLEERHILEWRDVVEDGRTLSDHPLIQLINVTMERGPGFDVIDPFGFQMNTSLPDGELDFVPVEVKAVDGTVGPFDFRFTVNEYRQAKAFVQDGEIPYVIRFVYVPDPGTTDWPAETEIVAERMIGDVSDLDEMVDTHRFEQFVKGGYMNMRVE